jgi:hypothetical protein
MLEALNKRKVRAAGFFIYNKAGRIIISYAGNSESS